MVAVSGVLLVAAYFTIGTWLARRVFRLDDDNVTPAVELNDGADFVPTKRSIIFGHHFTSIAGTGPIVGPAIAVMWGWLPALVWVVLGSIFIGAVHDLGAIVVSLRKKGRSIGDIAGDLLGPRARVIFLGILVMGLWLVLAVFGLVIASVLRQYPGAIFPVMAQIPLAVAVGWLLAKRKVGITIPSVIALGLMYASVIWGDVPAVHGFNVWMAALPLWVWVVGLLGYAYIASVIPVWALLQPRDYINALQLVTALGLLVVGLGVASLRFGGGEASGIGHQASVGQAPGIGHQASAGEPHVATDASATSPLGGEVDASPEGRASGYTPRLQLVAPMVDWHPPGAPPLLPILFITVACGACSGFHCLVGSGTTSKQLARERDAKAVGYGSMLTEGFLAVIVIAACAGGIGLGVFRDVQHFGMVRSTARNLDGSLQLDSNGKPHPTDAPAYKGIAHTSNGMHYEIANSSAAVAPSEERLRISLVYYKQQRGASLFFSQQRFEEQRDTIRLYLDQTTTDEALAWRDVLLRWDEYSLAARDSLTKDQYGSKTGEWIRLPEGAIRIQPPVDEDPRTRPAMGVAGPLAFTDRYLSWQSAGSLSSTVGAFVEGGANFLTALAIPRHIAIALMAVMVASFAATTMDTSCRLQRYVVQELSRVVLIGRRSRHSDGSCPGCGYDLTGTDPERALAHDAGDALKRCPECNAVSSAAQRESEGMVAAALARASWWNPIKWLTTTHGATMFAVVTAAALAFIPPAGQQWSLSNAGMGAMVLWPLFGAVNQLLAGFAFVVIVAWLRMTGRPWWFAVVPGVIMLAVPAWALAWQAFVGNAETPSWVSAHKWPLVVTAGLALGLEVWLVAEAVGRWGRTRLGSGVT